MSALGVTAGHGTAQHVGIMLAIDNVRTLTARPSILHTIEITHDDSQHTKYDSYRL